MIYIYIMFMFNILTILVYNIIISRGVLYKCVYLHSGQLFQYLFILDFTQWWGDIVWPPLGKLSTIFNNIYIKFAEPFTFVLFWLETTFSSSVNQLARIKEKRNPGIEVWKICWHTTPKNLVEARNLGNFRAQILSRKKKTPEVRCYDIFRCPKAYLKHQTSKPLGSYPGKVLKKKHNISKVYPQSEIQIKDYQRKNYFLNCFETYDTIFTWCTAK